MARTGEHRIGESARVDDRAEWEDQPIGAEDAGTQLPCVICGHRGTRKRRLVHMTHGVAVWLCERHACDGYLDLRGGRRFAERLAQSWSAAGALTKRRVAAIRAHVRERSRTDDGRLRPGSYSWPRLRAEAEWRFAAGEDPRVVIAELRDRHENDSARAPSVRTMRRWYTQARWRRTENPQPATSRKEPLRVRVVPEYMLLPPFMHPYLPQMRVDRMWRGP